VVAADDKLSHLPPGDITNQPAQQRQERPRIIVVLAMKSGDQWNAQRAGDVHRPVTHNGRMLRVDNIRTDLPRRFDHALPVGKCICQIDYSAQVESGETLNARIAIIIMPVFWSKNENLMPTFNQRLLECLDGCNHTADAWFVGIGHDQNTHKKIVLER